MEEVNKKINQILEKYKLSIKERKDFLDIVYPIYKHEEFQKRMTSLFFHHGSFTLGEHILEDSVLTYLLCQKYRKKYPNINVSLAIKISMLHDLYTVPWQNNQESRVNKFSNKHGFRHPIEAIINAYNWFPSLFTNYEESKIIIDGVIHHMYPLPSRVVKDFAFTDLELKNYNAINLLPEEIKKIIVDSSMRHRIGNFSFSRSKYPEGKIMSLADKKVSFTELKKFSSAKALITGKNKTLKNNNK